MGERLMYRLPELGLVHAELSDRPAHAHPRAHQLGFRVDPETYPDALAGLPRYAGEAIDLVSRLDVDREDAVFDGPPELVVDLAGTREDDVLGLETCGQRHRQFSRGCDLCPGLPFWGYELAHPEARVRLYRV